MLNALGTIYYLSKNYLKNNVQFAEKGKFEILFYLIKIGDGTFIVDKKIFRSNKKIMNENFKLNLPHRPRRLRRNPARLAMCAETSLSPSDLIQPLFVVEGRNKCEKIDSMPGISRLSIDRLLKKCETLLALGVPAVALFPQINPRLKNNDADEAVNPDSVQNKAIRAVKKRFPELQVVADIALDPYTSHGHDGILNKDGDWILNDETVEVLVAMSAVAAQSGADFIAPSDMMDGRVGAIREALDELGFENTAIMAYTAKYASAFYGPFREAVGTLKKGKSGVDKSGYQLNPANTREALREASLDEKEGADIIMVKPAGHYLDIVSKLRQATSLPIAAYQVSGEYSMVCAAAQNGWIDFDKIRDESLISIKRAGADMILTYFAESFAQSFKSKK